MNDHEELDEFDIPEPSQQSLDSMLAWAVGVRVWDSSLGSDNLYSNRLLVEEWGQAGVEGLRRAFRISEDPETFCITDGISWPVFEFLGQSGECLARIGLMNACSLSWKAWGDEAELLDCELLKRWLAERGLPARPCT